MKTTFIHNIRLLALVTAFSGGLLVSCESTDYPDPQPSANGFLTSANALIVNATNAAGLTALIENVTVSTGLAPGNNTAYTAVPVSSNQVRIQGAGGTLASTDLSAKSTFAANTNYTVFVTDTINRPRVVNSTTGAVTDAGGVRLLTVTDPISQTLTAGSGGVRFFHLAPDAGLPTSSTATTPSVVSVRLSAPTSTSTVASFMNRAYRNVSNNTFTSVPAGTYRVDVFTGTTIPTAATATPAVSSTITVETSKLYTLYARGLQRNRTLSVNRIQHN